MKEKKSIDRIYQEKFKDFEREPDDKLWDNIASRLDKEDKKKPLIIPFWWRIGGVAAVFAVIIGSLLFTQNQSAISNDPAIVQEDPDTSNENKTDSNPVNTDKINKSGSSESIAAEDNSGIQETAISSTNNRSSKTNNIKREASITENSGQGKASEKQRSNRQNRLATQNNSEVIKKNEKGEVVISPEAMSSNASGIIAENAQIKNDSINTESILVEENALAKIEEEKENSIEEENAVAEANNRKLRLSTFAAPVFYKNIGSGNELSNQLADNNSSSEVTFSYGVKVAYQLSEKLRIRTGISKVDISNKIEGIAYSPSMASSFENISPQEENIDIRSNGSPQGNELPIGSMGANNSLTTAVFTPGEIQQQFGYIEIPVELEYALINRRFGLNIIGGASSLFLDNNRIDLVSGESKTNLGEATNINNTSFSTNIGLGMDYNLSDKFSISVEPIFKYQLNTFNNVDNVQPINFGVYSGLNFRF